MQTTFNCLANFYKILMIKNRWKGLHMVLMKFLTYYVSFFCTERDDAFENFYAKKSGMYLFLLF